MPYVIDLPQGAVKFPETCPYCGTRKVDAFFQSGYTKGTGYYLFAYTTKTWTLSFPACQNCVRRRTSQGRLGWCLIAGVWALLLTVFAIWGEILRPRGVQFYAVPVALASSLAGGIVLLVRNLRHGALRVAYIGDGRVVFCAKSRDFAEEFAAINGTTTEYKRFVVKVS